MNNAGDVTTLRHFLDSDPDWWDRMVRTNLTSHYLCTRGVAGLMAAAGGGCVINMSSGGANRSHRGMVAYDATKGAIEAMTRSLALDLAPYGIRVNALVPGLIATNPAHLEPAARKLRDETIPLGRGGTPEDLAGPGGVPGLRRRRLRHRRLPGGRRRGAGAAALAAGRGVRLRQVPAHPRQPVLLDPNDTVRYLRERRAA